MRVGRIAAVAGPADHFLMALHAGIHMAVEHQAWPSAPTTQNPDRVRSIGFRLLADTIKPFRLNHSTMKALRKSSSHWLFNRLIVIFSVKNLCCIERLGQETFGQKPIGSQLKHRYAWFLQVVNSAID